MSTETKNHKLFKYEDNDVADLRFLHNSMETIGKGLTLDVGTSTGTGNDYVLNLGSITLSSANKGIAFKFWADKDSNGAVTINGTYHLVKANGNPVKNLKRNAPYTITYDGGTNFILASGSCDDVSFTSDKLLEDSSANNSDGEKVNGTMPNIGQQTATINAGGKVTISKGYHDGTGYIQSNSMGTQLSNLGATLTSASQLVKNVKAVNKNGNLITGTATIQSLGGFLVKFGSFTAGTRVDLGFYPKFVYIIHGGTSGANWSNSEMNITDDFSGHNKELYVISGGNGNGKILSGGGTLTRDSTGFTFTGNFTDYNYLAIG